MSKNPNDVPSIHPGFLKWRDQCERLSRILPVMSESEARAQVQRGHRRCPPEPMVFGGDDPPAPPEDPIARKKWQDQEDLYMEALLAATAAKDAAQNAKVFAEDAELAEMIAEMSVQLSRQTPGEIRGEMEQLASLAKQLAAKARAKADAQGHVAMAAQERAEEAEKAKMRASS